jgi:hypothetical protein
MKPEDLIKGPEPKQHVHLNVRMIGEDRDIWAEYVRLTPHLTDSQRARDAFRYMVHALLTKDPNIAKLGVLKGGRDGRSTSPIRGRPTKKLGK